MNEVRRTRVQCEIDQIPAMRERILRIADVCVVIEMDSHSALDLEHAPPHVRRVTSDT